MDLLVEETGEFADASAKSDIVGIADALADIVYVAYGAAVTYGIDLDAALREVHRSNMSKLDEQGRPVYREDGKVLKSARYTPPDIRGILSRQSSAPLLREPLPVRAMPDGTTHVPEPMPRSSSCATLSAAGMDLA